VTKAMVYVALVKWLHRTVRPGVDVSCINLIVKIDQVDVFKGLSNHWRNVSIEQSKENYAS
jgi:hypothetical protein